MYWIRVLYLMFLDLIAGLNTEGNVGGLQMIPAIANSNPRSLRGFVKNERGAIGLRLWNAIGVRKADTAFRVYLRPLISGGRGSQGQIRSSARKRRGI